MPSGSCCRNDLTLYCKWVRGMEESTTIQRGRKDGHPLLLEVTCMDYRTDINKINVSLPENRTEIESKNLITLWLYTQGLVSGLPIYNYQCCWFSVSLLRFEECPAVRF